MARQGDLPSWFAKIHPRYRVPHRAEVVLGLVVSAPVLTMALRGAIGVSSFGVLLYYLVANISAFTQTTEHRRYSKSIQILGAAGCLILIGSLPAAAIVGGLVVVAAGAAYRLLTLRTHLPRRPPTRQ